MKLLVALLAATFVSSGTGAQAQAPPPTPTSALVDWTNTTGVAAAPGRLTKTRESSAWDSGAVSTQAIVSTDGHVEFVASDAGRAIVGLSHGDDDAGDSDVDFGVRVSGTELAVIERGRVRHRAPLAIGDRIRIAVEAGRVVYRQNGALIYSSRAIPTFPLLVDTSIRDRTSVGGVVIFGVLQSVAAEPPNFEPPGASSVGPLPVVLTSGSEGALIHYDAFEADPGPDRSSVPSGGAVTVDRTLGLRARAYLDGLFPSAMRRQVYAIGEGPATEAVTWTRLDGVAGTSGALTKSRATRAWDSGAVSTHGILSEDGYFEFTLADRGRLVAGLSRGDRDATDDDVDFGFQVSGEELHIFELGRIRAGAGTVRPGDRLRVALESGELRYFRNGVLLHQSVAVPDFPLLVDTSIHHRAAIGDAVISGVLVALTLPDPQASPPGGRYDVAQSVVLTSEGDASIHYSTDGGDPGAGSPSLPSGDALPIDRSLTLRARALRDGWLPSAVTEEAYELVATAPVASPPPGAYSPSVVVSLTTATQASEIRYSIDGVEPNESSTLYTAPLTISVTTTLRARTFRPGWTASESLSATYQLLVAQASPPVFDPPGGTYLGSRDVRITSETPGASIHYTSDGSEPTEESQELSSGDVVLVASTTVLKAIASKPGLLTSPATTTAYVIVHGIDPALEPSGGTFSRTLHVRVACPVPEAIVRYTTDGEAPTQYDAAVACGGTIPVAQSLTLSVRAYLADESGEVVSGSYRIAEGIAAGPNHVLLQRRDGTVWGWGDNQFGQLGDGTETPTGDPKQSLASGMTQVAAGGRHSLALAEDGVVWAWGDGAQGQLGISDVSGSLAPLPVSTLNGVTAIAAGESHSLALRSDGTVWAWGDNAHGQLGNGSTNASVEPTQVTGLTEVVEIAAGSRHSLARRSDGSVWTWGANTLGQLGTGTVEPGLVPSPTAGLPPVVSIAAGDEHSLAVGTDGLLWAWGSLAPAQLEPGTVGPVLAPMRQGMTSCGDGAWFSPVSDARLAEGGASRSVVATGEGLLRWEFSSESSGCQPSWLQLSIAGELVRLSVSGRRHLAVTSDGTVWYWEDSEDDLPGSPYPVTLPTGALRALPPTIGLRAGTYSTELDVTLTAPTPGSVIHYTTEGEDPDLSSPVVASGSSIRIDRSAVLRAIAAHEDRPSSAISRADYVLKVAPPVLNPPPGAFHEAVEVTIDVATSGAALRVRTDGLPPQPGDPELAPGAAVVVSPPGDLQVEAFRDGWESTVTGGSYRVGVVTPTISPAGGVFNAPVTVTITTPTPGAILFYTLDLIDPAFGTPIVSGSTLRIDRSGTIRVIGYTGDNQGASDVATANFRFALPMPTVHADRPMGRSGPFYLTGATTVAGAIVRCTLDGTQPHARSPICNLPIPVDATAVVKARAFLAGWDASPVVETAVAVSDPVVLTPVFSLPAGRYPSRRTVRVSTRTPGAAIHYTTNGSDPTEADPLVASGDGLDLDRSLTLKARAFVAGAPSLIARADYVLTGAVLGDTTVLALKADGSVWAWGDNQTGLVGNGLSSSTPVTRPEPLPLNGVVSIALARSHAVALREDGSVWTWGANEYGQRGLVPSTMGPEPTAIASAIAVAAGETFGAALLGDGTLWTWGGSLEPEAHVPRQIPGLHCADLQAARDRIACIDATGVTLLGYSHGDFTPVPELSGLLSLVEADMTLVGGGDRRGLVHVEGVGRHDLPLAHAAAPNVLVDERGVAWSAEGHSFALGSAAAVLAESSPAVGVAASAAVDASGTLWRWGENSRGQLGDGTTTARLHPGEVPDFPLFSDPWFVQDTDMDGLDNLAEHYLGSDPLRADTNGDGVVDGPSLAIGRDPVSVDLDADGLANAAETRAGTDLFNPDSDGDGVLDGLDAFPLDPSRSGPPLPDPTDAVAPLILLREPASAVLISTTP